MAHPCPSPPRWPCARLRHPQGRWADGGLGRDTVTLKFTINGRTGQDGWRYRIWLTNQRGQEQQVLVNRHAVPAWSVQPTQAMTLGQGWGKHPAEIEEKDGQWVLTHTLDVDDDVFHKARLQLEYYPHHQDLHDMAIFNLSDSD
ncbi:hypothetical protein HNQ59_001553 [Chitinivorax tropicus]|uniref:Uncharacterized protein n=1 Tax=Chitinivorax tropicus TaxID=714531 RepID=A0A840ML91_9PROT|nr:hypothetical protein [Chitinivorax tropicus]MBB5018265.1 hypothetical protein [Chitinivorax tropicus]